MSAHSYKSWSKMSQSTVLITVLITVTLAVLTTWCVFLTIQNRQLQENQSKMMSMLYRMQGQLDREREERQKEQNEFQRQLSEVYNEFKGDVKKLARENHLLNKMVLRYREDARNDAQDVLSLQIDLTNNVEAMKGEHEIDVARIDEKVNVNQKKMDEKIDENQEKVNDSMRGLAELFVNEMTKFENRMAKYENETRLIHERIKQLEAMAREPVMIENKVRVETEYHHHHHEMVQFREPQLTLGERIGQIIGGAVQSGATYLLSKAMRIIGLS